MTLLDTEPLDGVDYRNGVIGYITLVSIPIYLYLQRFSCVFMNDHSKNFQGVDPTSIKNGSTINAGTWYESKLKSHFMERGYRTNMCTYSSCCCQFDSPGYLICLIHRGVMEGFYKNSRAFVKNLGASMKVDVVNLESALKITNKKLRLL